MKILAGKLDSPTKSLQRITNIMLTVKCEIRSIFYNSDKEELIILDKQDEWYA